jgi:hypothetical protein
MGRVTEKNAAALAKEAAATPVQSSIVVKRGANWVPKTTKPSRLQPAADAMTEAAAQPGQSVSWPELAMLGGGGYMLGGPKGAAALGAIRLLNRPGVKSGAAQAIHSTAPALNAATYGAGGALVDALTRLLGGQE